VSTFDTTVDLARAYRFPKHRARRDFDWSRPASAASLVLLALGVYGAWAWVAGPFLIDLIGLWPTRAVGVALIAATLWRR
jgi:hypothetical protein